MLPAWGLQDQSLIPLCNSQQLWIKPSSFLHKKVLASFQSFRVLHHPPLFQIVSEFPDKRVVHGWVVLGRVEPRLVELRQWWGVGRGCTPSSALSYLPSPLTKAAPPQIAPSPSRKCSVTSRLPWACVCGPITSLLGQPCFGHVRLCLQRQVVSPGPWGPPSSWGIEEEDVLGKGLGPSAKDNAVSAVGAQLEWAESSRGTWEPGHNEGTWLP